MEDGPTQEVFRNPRSKVTKALLGEDNVRIIRPFMSSEDFSEYLNRIPGAIIRVGIRDEEHQVSLHNQQMDFNDEVLPVAVSVVEIDEKIIDIARESFGLAR